jgi:hypothetical protein
MSSKSKMTKETPKNQPKEMELVIQIIPGQAGLGLMTRFSPEEYKGKSIKELIDAVMDQQLQSEDERKYKGQIDEKLAGGGILLHKYGVLQYELKPNPLDYAEKQQYVDTKEDFLYIELNAILPANDT